MIAAALGALPLLAQAGQGLIGAVSQDVTSFLSAGQTNGAGQNVPGSAGSVPAASSGPPSPMTLSSVAQHLSSSVLGALNTAQSDLSDVASFASGRSGTSSAKYQAAESLLNGLAGQMSGLLGGSSGASTLA